MVNTTVFGAVIVGSSPASPTNRDIIVYSRKTFCIMFKIVINVDAVLPQLSQVVGVINSKNSLPILGDVLVTTNVDGNNIMLNSSDSETWLSIIVPCVEKEVDTEAKGFCVNATDFHKALANLKGEVVTMMVDFEKNNVQCAYKNGLLNMPIESMAEYPQPMMDSSECTDMTVKGADMVKAIEKAGFAVAQDEIRPIMNGVHFDFLATCLIAVATDGQKLAKYSNYRINNPSEEPAGFTLPKKPANIVLNILNGFDGDVTVRFNDKCVWVANGDFTLVTRLIEGNYPNYDRVIPTDNTIVTNIKKADFINALKRVTPMGNALSELVRLSFKMGELVISAEDYEFSKSAKEHVECDYASTELEIGFKGSILMSVLQNIDDETVHVEMKEPSRSALFTPKEDAEGTKYVSLLMPMLLNK